MEIKDLAAYFDYVKFYYISRTLALVANKTESLACLAKEVLCSLIIPRVGCDLAFVSFCGFNEILHSNTKFYLTSFPISFVALSKPI